MIGSKTFFEVLHRGGGVLHYAKPLKYLDWDKAVITRTRFRMG
jgi:hypothetical protein